MTQPFTANYASIYITQVCTANDVPGMILRHVTAYAYSLASTILGPALGDITLPKSAEL